MKARASLPIALQQTLNVVLVLLLLVCSAVCKDDSSRDQTAPRPPASKPEARQPQAGQPSAGAPGLWTANQMLQAQGLVFIENRGQFDSRVKFLVKGNGANLWLTNDGVVFDFQRPAAKEQPTAIAEKGSADQSPSPDIARFGRGSKSEPPPMERLVFKQKLVSARSNPTIEARDPLPGSYNYFIGNNPDKWRTHVTAYKEIVYRDIWKGVDLKLFANGANLEEEFIVHPGADPSSVELAYEGIQSLTVADDGSLKVATAFGDIVETSPSIYQEIAGKPIPLSGSFKVGAQNSYAFEIAKRDEKSDLIIDPTIIYSKPRDGRKAAQGSLLYSTYLGGSATCGDCGPLDYATGIAVDASGSAYVGGTTRSTDFPTTSGAYLTTDPTLSTCGFITKFTPLGNQLQYSTYLCGTAASIAGIAIDSRGEAYVIGLGGAVFPTTPNALQQGVNGIFMTVLSAAGDALVYSTGFGVGDGFYYSDLDLAANHPIAVDSSGRAYLTGTAGTIPTTPNAYQTTYTGTNVAFLGVLDPSQSGQASLIYGSYLGGSTQDWGTAVAVDAYGMAYLTGFTFSSDFPVTPGAFQTTFPSGGGEDAFVAKFNPLAPTSTLIYSTYLGGDQGAAARAIAVDSLGNAYVSGFTESDNFPITAGAIIPIRGNNSGFVTKLNAAGNDLIFSTFWGGLYATIGSVDAIAVDSFGNTYVAGTVGTGGQLLVTSDAYQTSPQGFNDAFVSKFDSSGTVLIYSSYLGGLLHDNGMALAVDSIGDAYVAGFTRSANFPVTQAAYQQQLKGTDDAFVTKLPLGGSGTLAITGILPNAGGNAGTVTAQIIGTGFHQGASAKLACGQSNVPGNNPRVSGGGQILTATYDLTQTAAGICDVVVTNADMSSVTLPHGFTVQQGGAPQLWVEMGGNPTITSNGSTYAIDFGNTGTVDAHDAVLNITIPPNIGFSVACPTPAPGDIGLTWDLPFSWCQIPISYPDDNGNQVIPIWIFTLGAGAATGIQISITPLPPLPQPHQSIQLMHLEIGSAPDSPFSATGDPSLIGTSPVAQVIANAILQVFGSGERRSVRRVNGIRQSDLPRDCFLDRDHIFNCFQHLLIQWTYVEDNKHGSFPEEGAIGGTVGAWVAQVPLEAGEGAGETLDTLEQALRLLGRALVPILKNKAEIDGYAEFLTSGDPNDLGGPIGIGVSRWVSGAQQLGYGIFFYNEPGASAPAQKVVVTNPIAADSDWSTIALTNISIPELQVPIPPTFDPAIGWYDAKMNVDLRPSQDLFVNIDANLNPSTGLLTWTFQSIDPTLACLPRIRKWVSSIQVKEAMSSSVLRRGKASRPALRSRTRQR